MLAHELHDVAAGVAVERGGRLIQNQDVGTADDGARDRHALLFAAAQLHRRQFRPVLQADDLEVLRGLLERLVPVALLQDQRDGHVLGGRQPRKQMIVLEYEADLVQPELGERVVADAPDVGALDLHGAAVRPQDAGDHAEHRGLAAAGRTDDIEHLAEMGLEAHVLDGMGLRLALAEPFVEAHGLVLRYSATG